MQIVKYGKLWISKESKKRKRVLQHARSHYYLGIINSNNKYLSMIANFKQSENYLVCFSM